MAIAIASPTVTTSCSASGDMSGPHDLGFGPAEAGPHVGWSTVEPVVEVAVGYRQADARHRHARHGSLQELAADRRQHRVGEDGVDHAPAALDLGAPAHDQLHRLVVIREWNLVVLEDPLRDARHL